MGESKEVFLDLLQDVGLLGCKPATSPLTKGVKFCSIDGKLLADQQQCRRLVGGLLYLGFTRLYISCTQSNNLVSSFKHPGKAIGNERFMF